MQYANDVLVKRKYSNSKISKNKKKLLIVDCSIDLHVPAAVPARAAAFKAKIVLFIVL